MFVLVPEGGFLMGSTSDEASASEQPLTRVRISKAFYIGKHEVTQGQWQAVMGSTPSYFPNCGTDCPVESVSWDDVQEFVQRLNSMEGGMLYRLPTEVEWEFAARAGTTGDRYSSDLDAIAWWQPNSLNRTNPVGQNEANLFGLHDMIGNVAEWVQDFGAQQYLGGTVTDPTGPEAGFSPTRIYRGGWYAAHLVVSRATVRYWTNPGNDERHIGFRLARSAESGT